MVQQLFTELIYLWPRHIKFRYVSHFLIVQKPFNLRLFKENRQQEARPEVLDSKCPVAHDIQLVLHAVHYVQHYRVREKATACYRLIPQFLYVKVVLGQSQNIFDKEA